MIFFLAFVFDDLYGSICVKNDFFATDAVSVISWKENCLCVNRDYITKNEPTVLNCYYLQPIFIDIFNMSSQNTA